MFGTYNLNTTVGTGTKQEKNSLSAEHFSNKSPAKGENVEEKSEGKGRERNKKKQKWNWSPKAMCFV